MGSFVIMFGLLMIRDNWFYSVAGKFGLIKNGLPTAFVGMTLLVLWSIFLAVIPKLLISLRWPIKFHFKIKSGINWLSVVPLLLAILWSVNDQILDSVKAIHRLGADAIYANIMMGMQPGFFEELLVRGTVFMMLLMLFKNSKWQVFIVAVISSLIFGSIHFINLSGGDALLDVVQQVVYATIIGLAFAVLYVRTGSLWAPIVVHSFVDITAFLQNSSDAMTWSWLIIYFLPTLIISLWMIRPTAPGNMLRETE